MAARTNGVTEGTVTSITLKGWDVNRFCRCKWGGEVSRKVGKDPRSFSMYTFLGRAFFHSRHSYIFAERSWYCVGIWCFVLGMLSRLSIVTLSGGRMRWECTLRAWRMIKQGRGCEILVTSMRTLWIRLFAQYSRLDYTGSVSPWVAWCIAFFVSGLESIWTPSKIDEQAGNRRCEAEVGGQENRPEGVGHLFDEEMCGHLCVVWINCVSWLIWELVRPWEEFRIPIFDTKPLGTCM